MQLDGHTVSRVRGAFPNRRRADVDAVLELLARSRLAPTTHDVGAVTVGGEVLRIPARIYFAQPSASARASLSDVQRDVLACIFTRHHDGHVREAACARAVLSTSDWVPPFVIQLFGEYVPEIAELIGRHVERLGQPSYQRFVAENPAFMHLTRQRASSYWNCYYRSRWSRRADYPPLVLLDRLARAAGVPR